MIRIFGRNAFWALILAVSLISGQSLAQQSKPVQSVILTISAEGLFAGSAFGRRITAEIEAESVLLAAENRRIEAELTAEEKDLAERRPEMQAEAFRDLADAFDQKVQSNRDAQEFKAQALNQAIEVARLEFLQAARPVLEDLMREAGAGVILERASVFISANSTDITSLAIERIDAAIGDGNTLEDTTDQ